MWKRAKSDSCWNMIGRAMRWFTSWTLFRGLARCWRVWVCRLRGTFSIDLREIRVGACGRKLSGADTNYGKQSVVCSRSNQVQKQVLRLTTPKLHPQEQRPLFGDPD